MEDKNMQKPCRNSQKMKGLKNDSQFHHYYIGKLSEDFNSEMKYNISKAFKEYVDYVRELTDDFNPDKERDMHISFNYKRDYREELKAFVISNGDEDILDEMLKDYDTATIPCFVSNDFILNVFMFDLAKENNVKITVYNGRVFINKRPYETDAMVLTNVIPSAIEVGDYFITHKHTHDGDSTYYCVGYDGHYPYTTFDSALTDALRCKKQVGVRCCVHIKTKDGFEIAG